MAAGFDGIRDSLAPRAADPPRWTLAGRPGPAAPRREPAARRGGDRVMDAELALSVRPQPAIPDPNPELVALIRDEIARQGPITFARFMELAPYAPELGYSP